MGAFKYSQLAWKEQAAKRLTANGKFVAGAFFDKDGAVWGCDGPVAFTKEQLLIIAGGFGEAETGPVWKTWRKTSKCPGGQVEAVRGFVAAVSFCSSRTLYYAQVIPLQLGDATYISTTTQSAIKELPSLFLQQHSGVLGTPYGSGGAVAIKGERCAFGLPWRRSHLIWPRWFKSICRSATAHCVDAAPCLPQGERDHCLRRHSKIAVPPLPPTPCSPPTRAHAQGDGVGGLDELGS